MKNYAFPHVFQPIALIPTAPTASPYGLSPRLLSDLSRVFERESFQATSWHERARLAGISGELERLCRIKTAQKGRR